MAIAVDATVVRLVLVPALMAMFDQWNWWLPGWLARILPSVDFEKPLPKVDLGDLVIIPDDISALVAPNADLRMVVKNAARLRDLAPDAICVADPLAFSGCGSGDLAGTVQGGDDAAALHPPARIGASIGQPTERRPLRVLPRQPGDRAAADPSGDDVARAAVGGTGRAGERAGHHRHRGGTAQPGRDDQCAATDR